MTELFGLPAHALLVHAPVALTPLVVIFCAIVLLRPGLRTRFGWWAAGASAALSVALFLAKESGEGLTEVLGIEQAVEKHEQLGNQTFVISLLLFIAVVAGVVVGRKRQDGSQVPRILGVVATVLGALVFVWTIRTGHAGADLVWDGWKG